MSSNRLGEIRRNKKELGNYNMKIIEYNTYHDIVIEFQDEHKTRIHTRYDTFLKGSIKNPYYPSVRNIGYMGEGEYNSKTHKHIYNKWTSMMARCYDIEYHEKEQRYMECYVCEEWHNFQNFAKWYEENYYEVNEEKMELDKDILIKGNKIYSPETCIFVPNRINNLFIHTNGARRRGKYPLGITEDCGKLRVRCGVIFNDKYKNVELGRFNLDEEEKAFQIYKSYKENLIKQIADEYEIYIPRELYKAMYEYEVEIDD